MTGEQTTAGRERGRGGLLGRVYRAVPRRIGYFWGPRLMSALRKRWVLLRNPHAEIHFGRYVYVGPGFSLHVPFGGTFVADDGVEFRRGFRAELGPDARVVIGRETRFTYYVLVQCHTSIEIGARCVFAQSAMIVDGSHRFRDLTKPLLKQGYDYRPIRIGDDASVMSKCTIIADVGERAFIGANSVVTEPIPAFSLAVGSPARVREYFGPPQGPDQGPSEADAQVASRTRPPPLR